MVAQPLFSVVIPVHNKGRLLSDALASVSEQTFCDFEIIVVDDASTDDGLSDIDRFYGLSLRVLHRHTPGPGGYAARNLGIHASNAEWIAFLDADDLWYPDHLASAAVAIDHYPQASVLCTGFQEDLGGVVETVSVSQTVCLSAGELIRIYAKQDLFHTNSMVVRRSSLLAAGGFPEHGVRRGGDHSLWLRLILLGEPVVLIPTVTTRYRRDHSGVVADPTTMAGVHPVTTVVSHALSGRIPIPKDWGPPERLALRRLANRRCLLWMLQLRRAGLSSAGVSPPYPLSTTFTDALRWILAVLAPPMLVALLQQLRRRLRRRQ